MTKEERGITLIALIITIIILVILAAVSIRSVYNMGIVNHAINGTAEYIEQSQKEEKIMDDTGAFLNETIAGLKSTDYSSTILTAIQGEYVYDVWNVEVITGCKPLGPDYTELAIYYLYKGEIYKATFDTNNETITGVTKTNKSASGLGVSGSNITNVNGTYAYSWTGDVNGTTGYEVVVPESGWVNGYYLYYDSAGVFLSRDVQC